VVQTFYNGVTQPVRSMIDAALRGTLMSKTEEEAYNLIEETALKNYQWSNERGQRLRVGGKYNVDALTLLTKKMDAMSQKFDKLNVNAVNSCAPSPFCDRCGALDHVTENYQVGNPFAPSHVSMLLMLNNFQPRPNNDQYFNSHNPTWKQHLNFSYRTDPLTFPRANARPAPPRFQRPSLPPQAPPPQKSNLESILESVILAQQKQDEYVKQLASKVNLLTTHNKMLETQIAQQASSSSTPPGRLPSKPEQNPREQCNAIVLRSGTKLEGRTGTSDEQESEKDKDKGAIPLPHESESWKKREDEKEKETKSHAPKPYMPPLPFPQRFPRAKIESQFGKFLDMLKKLHLNVPFMDALSQMPLYAKFLKKSSPKRGKLISMRLWP